MVSRGIWSNERITVPELPFIVESDGSLYETCSDSDDSRDSPKLLCPDSNHAPEGNHDSHHIGDDKLKRKGEKH